jgi:hypothetical protein
MINISIAVSAAPTTCSLLGGNLVRYVTDEVATISSNHTPISGIERLRQIFLAS